MMNAPETPRRRVRLVLLAALVPAIPIVIAVLLTSGQDRTLTINTLPFKPVVGRTTAAKAAPPAPGTVVALVKQPTTLRTSPGGTPIAPLATKTEFGSPQAMWVRRRAGSWLGVVSPLAGNHRLGWIPATSASLAHVTWQLDLSLSARKLTVVELGKVKASYTVAIGAPDSPTPTGRFAVTDRLTTGDPAGPYGCCILALSAHSPHAIAGWTGGDRIAIHSTPATASIGQPDSHGCVRVTMAEGRWLLAHIPLGTPALISS
jgi:lipoprotein-anchoring transpeptidase ErfK/SrfK